MIRRMSNIERIKDSVASYDYIRFALLDLAGKSRGPIIPSRHAVRFLETGVNIFNGVLLLGTRDEAIQVPREKNSVYGNAVVVPDLNIIRPIPWIGNKEFKVAELTCESRWKNDNTPQTACPRFVARQQLQRLEEQGFTLSSAFEIEYFLLSSDSLQPVFSEKDYMCHNVQAKYAAILLEIDRMLLESGVDAEKIHAEYCPGQFEFALVPKYGIEGADMAVNCKQGITEIVHKMGLKASFISKLSSDFPGNGAHFNYSLLSSTTGENVLYDRHTPFKLSQTAYHWIAGIMKHSCAIATLCCPTVNCYRRLFKPRVPSLVFWDIDNRNASLRVKNDGPSETYFENRIPSGLCNPYLVTAATIAAGLDGIINELECPVPGSHQDTESLPNCLEDALTALQADKELVTALGEEFVEWFVQNRQVEIDHFKNIHNNERLKCEIERYL